MALTEPLDLLSDFPGWTVSFDLVARQEMSRHASGRTRVKDLGSPLWRGSWVSRTMRANELDSWRARLSHAMVSQMTFTAWPMSRCRPILHPGSAVLPEGEVHTIGENNKSLRVDGLTGISLSVGDFIQIGDADLYRVLEPAAALSGLTPLFEVEPHLWPGLVEEEPVIISRPSCLMVIEPGSVSANADPRTGRGSVSFQAIEAR